MFIAIKQLTINPLATNQLTINLLATNQLTINHIVNSNWPIIISSIVTNLLFNN